MLNSINLNKLFNFTLLHSNGFTTFGIVMCIILLIEIVLITFCISLIYNIKSSIVRTANTVYHKIIFFLLYIKDTLILGWLLCVLLYYFSIVATKERIKQLFNFNKKLPIDLRFKFTIPIGILIVFNLYLYLINNVHFIFVSVIILTLLLVGIALVNCVDKYLILLLLLYGITITICISFCVKDNYHPHAYIESLLLLLQTMLLMGLNSERIKLKKSLTQNENK